VTYSNYFPQVNDELGKKILTEAKKVNLPAGSTVFYQGASCDNFLLVMQGSVKVFTRSHNGREIVLYRVEQGQSCTLTTSCLLANNTYPAEGVTETDIEALVIPVNEFNQGLANSNSFRQFVFNTYGQRLCEVICLVNDVSFNRIDIRLAKQLLSHADYQLKVNKTHQELATELGSAREVISRQLKVFSNKNWLLLGRGKIEITSEKALESLADSLVM